jgi:hypothetical protein
VRRAARLTESMSNPSRFVKSHSTAIAVAIGVLIVAALWSSNGSHKYLHAIGVSGAVFGGLLIACARLWGKLWFWTLLVSFAVIHVLLWWAILNVLLRDTQYMFIGLQVGVGYAEVWLMIVAILAVEKNLRHSASTTNE